MEGVVEAGERSGVAERRGERPSVEIPLDEAKVVTYGLGTILLMVVAIRMRRNGVACAMMDAMVDVVELDDLTL